MSKIEELEKEIVNCNEKQHRYQQMLLREHKKSEMKWASLDAVSAGNKLPLLQAELKGYKEGIEIGKEQSGKEFCDHCFKEGKQETIKEVEEVYVGSFGKKCWENFKSKLKEIK